MGCSTRTVKKSWVSLSLVASILCWSAVSAQLTPNFYNKTCPQALPIVKAAITQALSQEARMGASLLRLHFHDCFVNGCDGSILLDDTTTFRGKKSAGANANSARGFEVIDNIKTQIEKVCSGVVSCADILALATRNSVVQLGGPSWNVTLGRRDSRTASLSGANTNLPGPTSSLTSLISAFQAQGLSAKDMIALSGAHTIGQSRCQFFRSRIYNESNIDKAFAASLQKNCPFNGAGDSNLAPLDSTTANGFDNNYYKNLRSQKGVFHSDQELFNGGSADAQVTTYSTNQQAFFTDFAASMVRMGNIKPLTGTQGEIRKNCRRIN
ncbi:hypothetical protein SUGI_0236710 [Cryptomeria japonica]|uniref:peroxidase P7 n=1 Tax=Cryptomeria japonica TaxID=3369 RepID=UPI002408B8C1|nr:peroxidase P7 [Cryptomeria japonica]GLJ14631.1 hypothetical protein SUGI_0236710 [Cryptomeria japonica]